MQARRIGLERLGNQGIARPRAASAAEVITQLGAAQAQDYHGALLSIGLRLPGSTFASLEQAIARRELVRSWPLRGTLHFIPARDIRWMLELTAARVLASGAGRRAQLGLDAPLLRRCEARLVRALRGGKRLTREQAMAVFERAGARRGTQAGYHVLAHLALRGVICFGPRAGKQATVVLIDEWIPKPRRLDRESALATLAERYFTGHGPATLKDFVWWSGLTVVEAKRGLALAQPRLTELEADGGSRWTGTSAARRRARAGSVHLLPGFDEYLLGYQDRSAVVPACHAGKIAPGGNGLFRPTLVVDGEVVGTWRLVAAQRRATLRLEPFGKLAPRTRSAAVIAAERYRQFLELPALRVA